MSRRSFAVLPGGLNRPWLLLLLALLIVACGGTTPAEAPAAAGPIDSPGPPPADQTEPVESPPIAPAEFFQPGDTTRSLNYGGTEREYVLHIPEGYDSGRPTPMVLAFHGIGLNAAEMDRISGFSRQADASGFVVVFPNGTGTQKSWNGGHCCGEAAKNNVDDVGFVRALIQEVSSLISIDSKRVYATGFSNGAILAYRLACELSDKIAAYRPRGRDAGPGRSAGVSSCKKRRSHPFSRHCRPTESL